MTEEQGSAEIGADGLLGVKIDGTPFTRVSRDDDQLGNWNSTNEQCEDMAPRGFISLTGDNKSSKEDSDDSGAVPMSDDPRLEQAFNLIREVIADADRRAADELVARISGGRPPAIHVGSSDSDPSPDKRAPRGSAGNLIDRALDEAGDNGLTVLGIQAKAKTEFERMVSASAIRNWLKECERKRPPRYRQIGGVWYLAGRGPGLKVVG